VNGPASSWQGGGAGTCGRHRSKGPAAAAAPGSRGPSPHLTEEAEESA